MRYKGINVNKVQLTTANLLSQKRHIPIQKHQKGTHAL